jgi:hypothetical protein
LKWGQPAYLTGKPKTGSTIRIDAFGGRDERYAMFFHCQSRLAESFRVLYRRASPSREIGHFSSASRTRSPRRS